jgi:hypothetical protein
MPIRNELYNQALEIAGQFLFDHAGKMTAQLGFTYTPTETAPNTYLELEAAFGSSRLTGHPLPVSSTNAEDVPYPDPGHIHALRFYHDCTHVLAGLTFELADEIQVSRIHVSDMVRYGLMPGDLAYKILHADFAGQVMAQALTRQFLPNQAQFIRESVELGHLEAVVRAVQRQQGVSK